MSVIYRKADREELPVIALLERAYIECAWTEKMLLESFDSGLYDFFVAEIGGEIIAYGFIQWCLDEGNICNIATKTEFRNKGYASGILNIMLAAAKEKGVTSLSLEVNENNLPAINAYKKAGFTEIHRRKNYYGSDSALILQKNLT